MSPLPGKSVRLFLAEGTASGLTTAEIMNWTGHVLAGSRSGLPAFMKRPELVRTGVYFLSGPDPADPDTLQLYIGESDNVKNRLTQHNNSKDTSKDFWERTCVVTSKDQNITKAHARYLEARLIAIANAVDIAKVANGTAPSLPELPEADTADMEFFVEQVRLILPVLGFDFLRQHKAIPRTITDAADAPTDSEVAPLFRLVMERRGIDASAREIDGEFVVLAGSDVATKWSGKDLDYTYAKLHAKLIESKKLVQGGNGHLRFSEDVPFRSPSAASSVVLGRTDNGRASWKVSDSNLTYADWHSRKVSEAASEDGDTEEEDDTEDDA